MMTFAGPFLDVMVIIMLAVVGGLVLWLHYRLYAFKQHENKMPDLMEKMSESMNKANRGIFEMSRLVREEGPKLDKEIKKAQDVVQDLDFMMHKAEKLLKRMDEAFEKAETIATPVLQAAKTEEKNMLLGTPQKAAVKSNVQAPVAEAVDVIKSRVENTPAPKPAPKKVAKPQTEQQLERDFLLGLKEEISQKAEKPAEVSKQDDDSVVVKPKRMASPMTGAMAYGQQLSVNTSEAENDLRRALEGRL